MQRDPTGLLLAKLAYHGRGLQGKIQTGKICTSGSVFFAGLDRQNLPPIKNKRKRIRE